MKTEGHCLPFLLHCRDNFAFASLVAVHTCSLKHSAFAKPKNFRSQRSHFRDSPDRKWIGRCAGLGLPHRRSCCCDCEHQLEEIYWTRHPSCSNNTQTFPNLSWSDHASQFCPVNLVLLDLCLSPTTAQTCRSLVVHVHARVHESTTSASDLDGSTCQWLMSLKNVFSDHWWVMTRMWTFL
jgi:hypothetical protein